MTDYITERDRKEPIVWHDYENAGSEALCDICIKRVVFTRPMEGDFSGSWHPKFHSKGNQRAKAGLAWQINVQETMTF